jgi:hypothetical protein
VAKRDRSLLSVGRYSRFRDAGWQAAIGVVFYDRGAYEDAIEPYRRAAFSRCKTQIQTS